MLIYGFGMELWSCVVLIPLLIISVFVLYRSIRRRYPYGIQCWFCGEKNLIPYSQINSWNCIHCEQYNGFTKDGDYNKLIPAQYCEELNASCFPKSSTSVSNHKRGSSSQDTIAGILCDNCNRNQTMKIKQLANFVPSAEENYDLEVDAYQHHLEQVYRLCRVCKVNVSRELLRQDASIQTKMHEAGLLMSRSKMANNSTTPFCSGNGVDVHGAGWFVFILQVVSLVCALALLAVSFDVAYLHLIRISLHPEMPHFFQICVEILSQHILMLPAIGAFAKILAVHCVGLNNLRVLDAGSCFLWLINMILLFVLDDSHVYNQNLLIVRLAFTSLNFILSMATTFRRYHHNKRFDQVIQFRSEQPWSDKLPEFSDHEPSSTPVEVPTSSKQNGSKSVDVPCSKLNMLRLGTPKPRENQTGYFNVFGNTSNSEVMTVPSAEQNKNNSSHSYPLLSPARFCPKKFAESRGFRQNQVFTNGELPTLVPRIHPLSTSVDSNEWNGNANNNIQTNGNRLLNMTPHGVGRSPESSINLQKVQSVSGNGFFLKVLLAVSFAINITIVFYVLFKITNDPVVYENAYHFMKSFFKK